MNCSIVLNWLASTPDFAVPYALAALGLIICERAGVLALGAEGLMLVGALAGIGAQIVIGQPAVSLGLAVAGRFGWKDLIPYWIAQVLGAVIAAAALYAIASGKPGFEAGGFASNGYGALSPGGYSMQSALLIETILTAGFLIVILGSTSSAVPAGFAPIAIGLALTLIHLISIPVTNTSVNPARSTGVAFIATTDALHQLWLFWVAPLAGAAIGGLIWKTLLTTSD